MSCNEHNSLRHRVHKCSSSFHCTNVGVVDSRSELSVVISNRISVQDHEARMLSLSDGSNDYTKSNCNQLHSRNTFRLEQATKVASSASMARKGSAQEYSFANNSANSSLGCNP